MAAEPMLTGKVVVITGGGRGLGAAYARGAVGAGATVVVADVNEENAENTAEELRRAGGTALAVAADLRTSEAAQALIDRVVAKFGRIDGLVNNAGVSEFGPVEEQDEALFRRAVEVNLFGTWFTSMSAVRVMLVQGSGSIVNVTSGTAQGLPFNSAYGLTKGGVASLTYCWAAELGSRGIRVNAISPHASTQLFDDWAKFQVERGTTGLRVDKVAPETNAPVVVYLLSDAAAKVNGQVVRMESGVRLSLLTHPALLSAPLYRESWTASDIAAAFDEVLADRLQPVGLYYVDSTVVPPPDDLPTFEPAGIHS